MKKQSLTLYPLWLTYPALITFTIFFILPTIAAFFLAFSDWNILRLFAPKFNGIDNFVIIFKDEIFGRAVRNTLIYTVATTVLKTVLGLLLALAFVKATRMNNALRTIFYMPAILSVAVVGILFTAIFRMDGIMNHVLHFLGIYDQIDWLGNYSTAMICIILLEVWMWSGFCMTFFIAGLKSIPTDYYESATIDGASAFSRFRKITLPMLAPSFTVVITLNIIGGLKVFSPVYVLTNGGPGVQTQVLMTYVYRTFSGGTLGESTAASLLLSVVVTILSIYTTKFLTSKEVGA